MNDMFKLGTLFFFFGEISVHVHYTSLPNEIITLHIQNKRDARPTRPLKFNSVKSFTDNAVKDIKVTISKCVHM